MMLHRQESVQLAEEVLELFGDDELHMWDTTPATLPKASNEEEWFAYGSQLLDDLLMLPDIQTETEITPPLESPFTLKREREDDELTDVPATPPPVGLVMVASTDSSNSGGTSSAKMSLSAHVELLAALERLGMNRRNERDWDTLHQFVTRSGECQLIADMFRNTALLKQKCKLLLNERRARTHLNFWKRVKKMSSAQDVTVELVEMAGAAPNDVVDWNFSQIGEYLFTRASRNERAPGSIIEWPSAERTDFTNKLIAIHQSTSSIYDVYDRFKDLVVLSEVELAVYGTCVCETCAQWDLVQHNSAPELLRLMWTIKRAQIMRSLLELHFDMKNSPEQQFMEKVKASIPELKTWSAGHIKVLLSSSHNEKHCHEICASNKRCRLRKDTKDENVTNLFVHLALDQQEELQVQELANLLQRKLQVHDENKHV